ncbi:hypothetical protein [uncultured Chloroflexus sp.]|nr:hypothetical protein [uncultured Chloroflexus sp.]
MATVTGYGVMFALLALVGVIGMGLLHWHVAAPARTGQVPAA